MKHHTIARRHQRHLLNALKAAHFHPLYWVVSFIRCKWIANSALFILDFRYRSGCFRLTNIGSLKKAREIATAAFMEVPAYKEYCGTKICPKEWTAFPLSDKKNYILAYPDSQILAPNASEMHTIFRSSGATGKSVYWPQLKSAHRLSSWALQIYLENTFQIHQKRTLAIVGLSLGSWVGGDQMSSILKQCALQTPYSFSVFSPGNRHDEILEIAKSKYSCVDQLLLIACPSAIGNLKQLATSQGKDLIFDKFKYLVLGESFAEELRVSLSGKSHHPCMFSMYGSADTGLLGVESQGSVALRQLICTSPHLRAEFGIENEVPLFFHNCAPEAFLEVINHELYVTRWQGVPIVRYNLHDQVHLFDWKLLREMALRLSTTDPLQKSLQRKIFFGSPYLPPLIAVYGRMDKCLVLCGTNITAGMLEFAVRSSQLQPYLTGLFNAKIQYADNRQFLALDLELREGQAPTREVDQIIYACLVQKLGETQPEFEEDWRHIYSRWGTDPEARIIRINYLQWPALSATLTTKIKHLSIS